MLLSDVKFFFFRSILHDILPLFPGRGHCFLIGKQAAPKSRETRYYILNIESTLKEEDLIVCIDMPVHQHLRFTQRHFIDLQMAIIGWVETDRAYSVV